VVVEIDERSGKAVRSQTPGQRIVDGSGDVEPEFSKGRREATVLTRSVSEPDIFLFDPDC